MDLGLRDRVAIVTGASRGIGRQVAIDLAAEGCHVALGGRDAVALAAVTKEVERAGVRAMQLVVDLEVDRDATPIVRRVRDELGPVDILVNNAGGNSPRKLLELTDEDWQQGFEQNFFSAVRLALACVPGMQARHWGRIVNVASSRAREPDPYFGPYSAAKAALVNFSKNLSLAFASDGVLSNCVDPGITMTDGIEANAQAAAERMKVTPEEVMQRMIERFPIDAGRYGDPGEVSAAIVFLASDRASWITGATLAVDGGSLKVVP
ncbi:MAG TPA: SDR family NAD(P)-dependent oxidoreductase [Acidimicrobiia bacterium]